MGESCEVRIDFLSGLILWTMDDGVSPNVDDQGLPSVSTRALRGGDERRYSRERDGRKNGEDVKQREKKIACREFAFKWMVMVWRRKNGRDAK